MSDKLTQGVLTGSTDVSLPVLLLDASDHSEVTGKAHGDVTASYWRQGATREAVTTTSLAGADSAHADGGWTEVDASNQPGLYRFDLPDAVFAAGADWVVISIIVSGARVFHERFDLTSQSLVAAQSELTGAPAPTANVVDMIKWVFTRCRNKTQTTTTQDTILKDDGVTTLASASIADDGATLTRGEYS